MLQNFSWRQQKCNCLSSTAALNLFSCGEGWSSWRWGRKTEHPPHCCDCQPVLHKPPQLAHEAQVSAEHTAPAHTAVADCVPAWLQLRAEPGLQAQPSKVSDAACCHCGALCSLPVQCPPMSASMIQAMHCCRTRGHVVPEVQLTLDTAEKKCKAAVTS